jgi:hypothetical protein
VNVGNVVAREYKFLAKADFVSGRYQFSVVKMVCMFTFYVTFSERLKELNVGFNIFSVII